MNEQLSVVCLCAQWCGVCREYAAVFEQAAAAFGGSATFMQIDIEDDAELLDTVEIENFPTLLILRGTQPLFFGTVTPHAATLARLVQSALVGELSTQGAATEVQALAQRVAARVSAPMQMPESSR